MTGKPAFPRPGSATVSQTAPTAPMKPTPFVSLTFHPLLITTKVSYNPIKALDLSISSIGMLCSPISLRLKFPKLKDVGVRNETLLGCVFVFQTLHKKCRAVLTAVKILSSLALFVV